MASRGRSRYKAENGYVTSFKYRAVVSDDGSKPEIHSRMEQDAAALTKHTDFVTMEGVRRKIQATIGVYDELLTWSRNGKGGLATSQGVTI